MAPDRSRPPMGRQCFSCPKSGRFSLNRVSPASRLDCSDGGFCGKSTLLGNVSFHDITRVAARTLPDAARGENYFASDPRSATGLLGFPSVKSTLTENSTRFQVSASLDPRLHPRSQLCIRYTDKLRGEQPDALELRDRVDRQSLAGLRKAAEAVSRLPFLRQLRSISSQLVAKVLLENPSLRKLLLELATGELSSESASAQSAEVNAHLFLPQTQLRRVMSCLDSEPVSSASCSTDVRAHLLHSWAKSAKDPAVFRNVPKRRTGWSCRGCQI